MPENMEEIMKMAAALGAAIRETPRYAALRAADDRVRADKAATDALNAYNKTMAELGRKERSGQPIEVAEKRNLEVLHQAVASNETVKAFMRAHADHAELMRKVNDAIFQGITGEEKKA